MSNDRRLFEQEAAGAGRVIVNSVQAGDNITVDATDPNNPVVSASGGGSSDVLVASVTLVEDDLNDNANPVTLVAGVTGKIIIPIKFACTFNFVDNVYTTNDAAQWAAYINGVEMAALVFYTEGFLDDETSQFCINPINDNVADLTATVSGEDLVVQTSGTVTESDPGSSTVTVTTTYILIDAP